MRTRWIICGIASVGLTAASCACNNHKEKEDEGPEIKMTMDQLPDAVKLTLSREAEGGTIGDIDKETDEGKNVYEADATIEGKAYEIKVGEDGTLMKKSLEKKEDEAKEAKDEKEDSDKK